MSNPSTLLEQRTSLGALVRSDIPRRTFLPTVTLGGELFYDEGAFIISGHKKSGKSWAMLTAALDCVKAKQPAVYLDFENGERLFARRLQLLGADPDQIDQYLHYVSFPKNLTLKNLSAELEDIAEQLPRAFVVVDSLRGAIARLSPASDPLKLNDPQSIERAVGPMMEVAKTRRITVGIIDHSTKIGSDQDEYSTSNSGAKEQVVDAVYFWTKVKPYSKAQAGLVRIAITSDREGEIGFPRHFRVGGQGDAPFYFEPVEAADAGVDEHVVEEVRQFAADNPGKQLTQSDLRKEIKAGRPKVDAAIKWLVKLPSEPFDVIGGTNGGTVRYVWGGEKELSEVPNNSLLDNATGVVV
jgi:hypothetical protein